MENITTSSHDLKMIDRSQIIMSGVKKVDSFDKEEFLIDTVMGPLILKGEELELIKLDSHDGNISIKGKINSIAYADSKKTNQESLINKLFK